MAGREKLALLFLGLGGQQVLEGIVHDPQVRSQQPCALDGPHADLQVALGQLDVLTVAEDAGPLPAGLVKQGVDPVVGAENGECCRGCGIKRNPMKSLL